MISFEWKLVESVSNLLYLTPSLKHKNPSSSGWQGFEDTFGIAIGELVVDKLEG